MGVLQRFEKRLGGLVEGAFAKAFRGRVEPVELAAALAREADNNKAVGPARVLVPNVYEISLATTDYERLSPYALTLSDELASLVSEHAAEQGYTFVGPLEVTLVESAELTTGAFRTRSRVEAGELPPGPDGLPPAGEADAADAPDPGDPGAGAGIGEAAVAGAVLAAPDVPARAAAPAVAVPDPFTPLPATPKPRRAASAEVGRLLLPDGRSIPVTDALVVGRGADVDLRLVDAAVSRRHARLSVTDATVMLEDLGSTNGTFVNGRKVDAAALRDGDRLTFGSSTVVFRV